MKNYENLLKALVRYDRPEDLAETMRQLQAFDHDRGQRLVRLTREGIASVLERYLQGNLSAHEVEAWADAVEMREDIEFGDGNDEVSVRVIWEMANPLLTQPLTQEIAQGFVRDLALSVRK
jgi:hypothetical protein